MPYRTLFAISILVVSGCSKPTVTTSNASGCPSGVGGMSSSCCDSTGNVLSPPPSGCSNAAPGSGAIIGSNTVGAATVGNAVVGNSNHAGALVSTQGAAGAFSNTQAATAGGNNLTAASAPLGGTLAASAPAAANVGKGSGGGGSGGGGSGAAGMMPDLSTAPAGQDPTAQADSPQADTNIAGATFTNGGGGSGAQNNAANSNNPFDGLFGGSAGAGGAGGPKDIGFGANRSIAAMGSADPADYFSLIGMNDSLFKRVESRYREKQVAWSSSPAAPQMQVRPQMMNGAASIPK